MPLNTDNPQQYPLEETEPQVQQYPLVEPGFVLPSEDTASKRAKRAHFGMKSWSPGEDVLTAGIASGLEERLRESAAEYVNTRNDAIKLQELNKLGERRGKPITKEELDWVMSMSEKQAQEPFSVFEDQYAREFINYVNKAFPDKETVIDKALKEVPGLIADAKEASASLISTTEFAKKVVEDVLEEIKNQSTPGFIADLLKFLIPLYYDVKIRNFVKGMEKGGPFFTGTNMEEQRRRILSMHPNEGKKELQRIVNELKKDNPTLALIYAMNIASATSSDEFLDNFFQTIDITGLGLTGYRAVSYGVKVGKEIGRLADTLKMYERGNEVTQALKDQIKASSGPDVTEAHMLAGAGDVHAAAASDLARNIAARGSEIASDAKEEMIKSLTSAMRTDVDNLRLGPTRLAGEARRRLADFFENNIGLVEDMLKNVRNVDRLTPEALAAALKVLQKRIATDYRGKLDNAFIDNEVRYIPEANVYEGRFILGNPEGSLFGSEEEARTFAYYLNLNNIENKIKYIQPKQQGTGWAIEIARPIRETDPLVREALFTTNNTTPRSTLNTFIGRLRTPEDTLPKFQNINRHIAAYAPQAFIQLIYDMGRPLRKIGRKNLRDLERVLRLAQKEIDPETKLPGYFYKTIGEVEEAYMRNLRRLPSEDEVKAYFTFVQINELDRMFRSAAVYRNKHRLGVQEVRLGFLDADKKLVHTEWFDAIPQQLKDIPWGSDANLLFFNNQVGAGRIVSLKDLRKGTQLRKIVTDRLEKGEYRLYQIYDVDSKPLKTVEGVESNRVHYILVNSADTRPIRFEQVARRGGGHIEYDYKYYLKQARVRPQVIGGRFTSQYEGDVTVMAIGTSAQGKELSKHLNEVMRLMKADKKDEARAYLEANTPIPWSQFSKWDLNYDEPISVVQRGRTILDTDPGLKVRYANKNFVDATHDPHNPARLYSVQFTGERDSDLFTVAAKGSRSNPLFEWEPAKTVDPIPMMNRAIKRIVQSRHLEDYKISAIESWAEEAIRANILDASAEAIRRNPMYYFYNSNEHIRKGLRGTDNYEALMTSKYQIEQLLGQPTSLDMKLHALNQKIVDWAYGKLGPKPAELLQNWALPGTVAPWEYMRAMAFHSKLGLFNWVQMFVQMQTFTHILGVAGPVKATQGATASLLTRWLWIRRGIKDDAVLKEADKLASKFGWKPGEFVESHTELMNTGFLNVLGEHAMLDAVTAPNIVRGKFGQFLDAGSMFFREAERQVRMAAWHTAYKEFRAKRPTGKLTNTDVREILSRADLLYVNMSAASNSQLHRGIFSIPAQFLTYQLRLAEQFWSKRLTTQEKIRAFAAYALMYGFPIATGVTGIPVADQIRQSAIDEGIDTDANYLSQAINKGLPALAISMATGRSYNFGDRYGIQGFTTIREALWADREWWELLGGASGSVIIDTLRESQPLMWYLHSLFREDGPISLKLDDVANAARVISSVNQVYRGLVAFRTGTLMSRKGRPLMRDLTGSEAVFMTITGMVPDDITRMWDTSNLIKNIDSMKKDTSKLIVRELQRGYEAAQNNDFKSMEDYFSRARHLFAVAGFQPGEEAEILSKSTAGYEAMLETIDQDLLRKTTVDKYMKVLESQIQRQEREQKRRGTVTTKPYKEEK